MARRWDGVVQERLHKLFRVLGERFDGRIDGIAPKRKPIGAHDRDSCPGAGCRRNRWRALTFRSGLFVVYQGPIHEERVRTGYGYVVHPHSEIDNLNRMD